MLPNQYIQFASKDDEMVSVNSHTDRHGSYKSDANISEDEIIQGLMEISVSYSQTNLISIILAPLLA